MTVQVGHLEATLGLNDALFMAGMSKAHSTMRAAGASMKRAGRTMTMAVSLPLLLIGGSAVKMSASFEKSMSKIEGQVGIAAEKVEAMKKDVLALAGPTARAPQELADALFFVTSAGLRGADAMEVLRLSARGAASGFGETKIVADLVTSATNAYGIANLSAAQAMDTLAATVREGKSEALDIAGAMGQVLPIASNLGVSFQEVGAAIAAMSRTGTVATTAVIQFRQILASILKPSQQSEAAFRKMGTSSAEFRDMLRGEQGLLKVLMFLREQMKSNDLAFTQAFPNVRALSGALDVMGANAEDNIGIWGRMADNTGDSDKAFAAAAKTITHKFNVAMAEFKVVMIELGTLMIPFFTKLIRGISSVVKWFAGLSSQTKGIIIILGGLAAAVGPVLWVVGLLTTALTTLLPILVSTAFTIGTISIPIFAVIAAVAALTAAFLWTADNWDGIVERISDWAWWKNMIIDMVQFFIKWNPTSLLIKGYNALAKRFGIPIPNPFEGMAAVLEHLREDTKDYKNEIGSLGDAIKNALGSVGGLLPGPGPDLKEEGTRGKQRAFAPVRTPVSIADILARASSKIRKTREDIAKLGKQAVDLSGIISNTLASAFNMLGDVIGGMLTGDAGARDFFKGILFIIADFLTALGQAMIAAGVASEAFKDLFFSGVGAIIAGGALIVTAAIVRGMLQNSSSSVQGMRAGGEVTEGGVFQLHKDELVSLPVGASVASQRASRMAMGGGSLSTSINLRKFNIELDRERERMNR